MNYQQFLIVFALIVIQGHHGWARFVKKHQPLDFDMLLLTQTWLPVICKTPQRYYLSHFCSVAHTYNQWNIHGLWPEKRYGPTPENCADTPLNDEKIADLKTNLEKNWIDVFAVNKKETHKMRNFWEKEWKKHGTCAVKPNDKSGQSEYFKKTLYLFKQYNMNNIFKKANIVPEKEYTYFDLLSKIEGQVKKECQIACYVEEDSKINDKTSTIQYLKEVRICFGRDLEPVNCGKSRLPSCLRNTKIMYSEASPPHNRPSTSIGPNEMNPPSDNAPKTNPNRFGPRDFSFGIGLQGPAASNGP